MSNKTVYKYDYTESYVLVKMTAKELLATYFGKTKKPMGNYYIEKIGEEPSLIMDSLDYIQERRADKLFYVLSHQGTQAVTYTATNINKG